MHQAIKLVSFRILSALVCLVGILPAGGVSAGIDPQASIERTRLPNGRLLPINDTWAVHGKIAKDELSPRSASESFLMPDPGVAILGAGQGDDQIFAWLNFSSGAENKHRDTLSIGLFGHGEEVLSDIGDTHTRYRQAWASSMMSHNTVVVDGREAQFDAEHSGNSPVAFATNGKGFHLAAAESKSAYPGRTERYRRTLILLGEDANNAYLLDIFEVSGGKQHDYLLHGSADHNSTATIGGTELRPFRGTLVNPGAVFSLPDDEDDQMGKEGAFALIRDLQKGSAKEPLRLDFRLEESPPSGSRTIVAPLPGADVFLGRSPSIRRAGENNDQIDEYAMPTFVLRNRGENLDTIFVAAHEAVDDYPSLYQVVTRRDDDRLWISVTHAEGRDYISLALGESRSGSFETSKGVFATDASYAVVRLDRNDDIRTAHMVEGKQLQFRHYHLQGPGAFTGKVRRMRGGEPGETVFDLDRILAVRDPGLLIVEFPDGSRRGYTVTDVEERIEGSRVHVREAAGFAVKDTEIVTTADPIRTIEGTKLTYRLIDSTHSD